MTIHRSADATVFQMHGSRFHSYASPTRGQAQLCAWRLEIEASQPGVAHQVSHEEILLVLSGSAVVTISGDEHTVHPGDVIVFPAKASVQISTVGEGLTAWVTTSVGLTAVTSDGQVIRPPWVA